MSEWHVDDYRPGDYYIIDDWTGFKIRASESVKTHDGLRVHRDSVGEETMPHPQDRVRARADRQIVRDARPEPPDVFLDPGDVTADDL